MKDKSNGFFYLATIGDFHPARNGHFRPALTTLYNWINRKRILPEGKSTFRGYNTEGHPWHPPLEQKLQILHRCFEMGEDVQSVSNEVGYSKASIYAWRRKYIQKGAAALMNPSNERSRGKLTAGEPAPSKELDELKAKVQDMDKVE